MSLDGADRSGWMQRYYQHFAAFLADTGEMSYAREMTEQEKLLYKGAGNEADAWLLRLSLVM